MARSRYRGGPTALKIREQIYCLGIALLPWANLPLSGPSLFSGFRALWTPEVPLRVVVLWILVFLYTGRSSVTESRVSFYVCHHKT